MLRAAWFLWWAMRATVDPESHLVSLTRQPYLDLLERVTITPGSPHDFEEARRELAAAKAAEARRLDAEIARIRASLKEAHSRLDALNRRRPPGTEDDGARRAAIHEEIRTLEAGLRRKSVERSHGLDAAFANRLAKLDLIEHWPDRQREIEQAIRNGTARQRPHGNVEDIGIRDLGGDQHRDIKTGQDAIRELRTSGLLPPAYEEPAVVDFVREVAETVAAGSDLRVPLKLTVLSSREINAFALPGGFLFVNTGLIERASCEAELAGVIAHELSHVTARHGPRLMKRAQVANLVFQSAQIAALIFTGGAAGIGTYYGLQYGFLGLGLALDLTLLGVSREFEAEADQLGVQYAWRSGYDPKGFISFFDTMASESGYVRSASFFRTHPPFFDRVLATAGEIAYLPPRAELRTDSDRFQVVRMRLREGFRKEDRSPGRPAPSLRRR